MGKLSSYSHVTSLTGTELVPIVVAPGVAGGNAYITADEMAATSPFTERYMSVIAVDSATYGPGVADATAHVQALINAQAGVRKTIFFPPGTYLFNSARLDVKKCNLLGAGLSPNGGYGTTLTFTSTYGIYSSTEDNTGFSVSEMSIFGSGSLATNGQILLDFTGQNGPHTSNVRLWQTHYGMKLAKGASIECNYGVFNKLDLFECTQGITLGDATNGANSHVFVGGRYWTCTVGAYLFGGTAKVDNVTFVGTAFEVGNSPNEAIKSAADNVTFVGCRFESLNINIHILASAGKHHIFGGTFSSGFDIVDDNFVTAARGSAVTSAGESCAIPAPISGPNLAVNGSCIYDNPADGTPDGWTTSYSVLGTGFTMTMVTGDATVDTHAKITNVGTTNPMIGQSFTVEPNKPVAISVKCRTSETLWLIRAGTTNGGTNYLNYTLSTDGAWHEYRFTVTPTTATLWVSLYRNAATAGVLDFTDLVVNVGDQPSPGFAPAALNETGGRVFGQTTMTASAAVVPLVVRASPSQSAGLAQFQDSAGTMVAQILSAGGGLFPLVYTPSVQAGTFNGPYISMTGASVTVINRATVGNVPLIVQGMAAQTGNLQEWRDSAAAVMQVITATGAIAAAAGKVGFYGTAPIVKQTGVAVTAAGVHAALVALGLIT